MFSGRLNVGSVPTHACHMSCDIKLVTYLFAVERCTDMHLEKMLCVQGMPFFTVLDVPVQVVVECTPTPM